MSDGYTEIDYLVSTNEDWRDSLLIAEDEEPVDLTGSSFIAHIRETKDTLSIILAASTDNGLLEIAPNQGETFSVDTGVVSWNVAETTMRLIEPGKYVWDIVWIDADGNQDMIAAGSIEIVRGITRT
jgi:hypothetical protein